MARMPEAEITVTVEQVRVLLRHQHPDLAHLPLSVAGHGWDNVMVRLGPELGVRLPRRAAAAPLVTNEQRWLAVAAADVVGIGLPEVVRRGEPEALFPWPWSVVRWLPGAAAVLLPRARRGHLAAPLAAFCAQLHHPAPQAAPRNPVRGVHLADRSGALHDRLAALPRAAEVERAWAAALAAAPWDGPPLWLHGDLHPANLLTVDSRLTGVVDFGDLTGGDPATDLATAWLTFDRAARETFRRRLAQVDAATWARARGWALLLGAALYTSSDDARYLRRLGAETLTEVLTDPPGTGR